ncbi:MAG: ankyrin repeat domain-containing protein [Pseudomonadota bacterium]
MRRAPAVNARAPSGVENRHTNPKCLLCRHLIEWPYCFAFLTGDGIPPDIRENKFDHSLPYGGDGGIRFLTLDSPYGLSEEGIKAIIAGLKGKTVMPGITRARAGPSPEAVVPAQAPPPDLISVSGKGNLLLIKELLDRGADVNARGPNGNTALMSACRNCQPEAVTVLIRQGADVNAEDDFSRTPIYIAKAWGYPSIVEILRKHGAKE